MTSFDLYKVSFKISYQRVKVSGKFGVFFFFSVSFESLVQPAATTSATTTSVSQPTPTQDVTADTVTSVTEVTAAGQGEGQGQPAPAETAEPSEEQR